VLEVQPDEVHSEFAAEFDHGGAVRVVEDAECDVAGLQTSAQRV
jgi:hypothetical protein